MTDVNRGSMLDYVYVGIPQKHASHAKETGLF